MRQRRHTQQLLLAAPIALLAALTTLPVAAQRDIRFEAAQAPASGTLVLAVPEVAEGAARTGAFAQIDAASQGALSRATTAAGFRGKVDSQLDLPGIAGFDRVLLVGTGSGAADARRIEAFTNRTNWNQPLHGTTAEVMTTALMRAAAPPNPMSRKSATNGLSLGSISLHGVTHMMTPSAST